MTAMWRSATVMVWLAALVLWVTMPRREWSPAAIGARGSARRPRAPTASPRTAVWNILKDVYREFTCDRVMLIAAGITFYALLALFPAITALVSVYGMFADPNTVTEELQSLSGLLPDGAISVMTDQTKRIAAQSAGSLSIGLVLGVLLALWSANSGMKSIFEGLNITFGKRETRSFAKLTGLTLLFTAGAIAAVIVAMMVIVAAPSVLDLAGIGGILKPVIRWGRWPLLFALTIVGLGLLYRYGPDRQKQPNPRLITLGAVAASLLWLITSGLFSWYVSNMGNYNETYGSLGAVIGFLVWLWLTAIVILIGAELDAVLERASGHGEAHTPPRPY